MDTYLAYAADDAVAARYRVSDLRLPDPPALWRRDGPVDEVVQALLALPAHGARGSPMTAGFPVHFGIPPGSGRSPVAGRDAAADRAEVLSRIPQPRSGGCTYRPAPRGGRARGGGR
ncbi:hypothetical protein ACL03H_17135 [Saccharopolyspora sp. MS10]|uniref:hypothetical protein n=1 Tax=Saccharopolyspora sp. MS10 TaxID=3385973 RepID=UPI0039A225D6